MYARGGGAPQSRRAAGGTGKTARGSGAAGAAVGAAVVDAAVVTVAVGAAVGAGGGVRGRRRICWRESRGPPVWGTG